MPNIRRIALCLLGVIAVATALPGAAGLAAPTGEVKIGLAAEPNTFDPHLTVGRNTQIFVVNVYDGLTARDAQGHLVPALAESWKQAVPAALIAARAELRYVLEAAHAHAAHAGAPTGWNWRKSMPARSGSCHGSGSPSRANCSRSHSARRPSRSSSTRRFT